MSEDRYDVIVVGAGPAGASLAIRMARQGRSCLVVDGSRFPRDKTCGEGLMPAGVAELESLGIGPTVALHGRRFGGIRYRLADGTAAEASFPGDAGGVGIRRHHLDLALVRAAEAQAGVDLRLGAWVRQVELPEAGSAQPVVIELDGQRIAAPLLVAADGGRSRIRRQAGLEAPAPKRARFGVGGHLQHDAPLEPLVEVFVGGDHELYTTPVSEDVTCVALLVGREALEPMRGDLEAGLRQRLEAAGGRCAALARGRSLHRVKALGPLALQATRAHAEGLTLVGDAAGALDPITGEGVSLALVSSRILSEVLAEAFRANDFSARFLARWTRRRRQEVKGLARLTRMLLMLAQHPTHAARVVRALARNQATLERLLGVAAGTAPLRSLTLRDGLRLLAGV